MKSIILFTSQTSGTASLQRIISAVANNERRFPERRYYDELKSMPKESILSAAPPRADNILLYNYPPLWNKSLDLTNYRTIVNFRDPRDRICNVYHWHLVHPSSETPADRIRRIENMRELGIDRWVARSFRSRDYGNEYYNNLFFVLEKADAQHAVALTYARLCLGFDSLIERICAFLQVRLTPEQESQLLLENPNNLPSNPSWIGNQWQGGDVMPGRFKAELSDETIAQISDYYAPTLVKMAELDPDFADSYLFGIK